MITLVFFVCLAGTTPADCTRQHALRHYECFPQDCPTLGEADLMAGFYGLDRSLHYEIVYPPAQQVRANQE